MHEWPRHDGWTPWGAWHLKISKCIASSLPRAYERSDNHHNHSGDNTAGLICDIGPTLLYPRPALAQEADGHLRGAGCLEEAAPSLAATSWVSRCSQASGGCWNSTWRLQGMVQHWLKDSGVAQDTGAISFLLNLNTNTWILPCALHVCSWDNSSTCDNGTNCDLLTPLSSPPFPSPCSFLCSPDPRVYPHH